MARLVAFYRVHVADCLTDRECECEVLNMTADVSFNGGGDLPDLLRHAQALAEDDVERQLRERAESS